MRSSLALKFPLFKEVAKPFAYLDNAATTQKPDRVLQALDQFYRTTNSNVHRGVYPLSEAATAAYETSRKKVARFLGANSDEVIFTSGATASLNELALSLEDQFGPSDVLVLCESEHHSNLLPWLRISERKSCRVVWITVRQDGTLDFAEAERECDQGRVKLVALASVSHVLGNRHDVARFFKKAKTAGAITVLDATQSVARAQLDVSTLHCDALAFSGHKIYAPTGIGVLYASRDLQKSMSPAFVGGGMVDRLTKAGATSWRQAPWKFEAGTPPIEAAVGLAAAIDFVQDKDLFVHAENERRLIKKFALYLATQPGVRLLGWASALHLTDQSESEADVSLPEHEGLLSFTLEGLHPHDLAQTLADEGVAVRAGHHCAQLLTTKLSPEGCIRISLAAYNDEDDFDLFTAAFERCLELRSELHV